MAIIAIRVPAKISKKFQHIDVSGKRDPSDHITVAYFCPDELGVEESAKVAVLLSKFCAKTKPFEISSDKINCFPGGPDGVPVKAELKSKGLNNFRSELCKELKKCGLEGLIDGTYGNFKPHKSFNPHVTLSYNKKEIDEFSIEPIIWVCDSIELWAGENEKDGMNFEFKLGKKVGDKELVLLLTEIFKKLAS